MDMNMTIYDEKGNQIDTTVFENTEQIHANAFIDPNDVVLELGARFGSVSIVINTKLQNKQNHVAVDPDERIWNVLQSNRDAHDCSFHILKGVISKKPVTLQELDGHGGYGTTSVHTSEPTSVKSFTLEEVQEFYNLKFTALVADCEGFLETFFDDNPCMYDQLNTVLYEMDYAHKCDYNKIEQNLKSHGLTCIWSGFHMVWKRVVEAPAPSSFLQLQAPPSLHILIPSVARPSLQNMLDSILPYLRKQDHVTIVFDGVEPSKSLNLESEGNIHIYVEDVALGFWGHGVRNKYASLLEKTDFVLHADDDDTYSPDAFNMIRNECKDVNALYIFRMFFTQRNTYVPKINYNFIENKNIGTPCGIIPYELNNKAYWGLLYGGDFEFYESIEKLVNSNSNSNKIIFSDSVIYLYTAP